MPPPRLEVEGVQGTQPPPIGGQAEFPFLTPAGTRDFADGKSAGGEGP